MSRNQSNRRGGKILPHERSCLSFWWTVLNIGRWFGEFDGGIEKIATEHSNFGAGFGIVIFISGLVEVHLCSLAVVFTFTRECMAIQSW